MWDYLPDEVVVEFLQRLPVKSLIRLRCVSKSWNSLITSPAFINSHLTQSLTHFSNSNTKIVRYCTYPRSEKYILFRDENESFDQIQQLDFLVASRQSRHFILINFVNGLYCLNEHDRIIVWNPSIIKCITLPKPSITIKTHGPISCCLAFGFDSRTNDYKVVRFAFQFVLEELDTPIVEVYSLSEGSWRIISASATLQPEIRFKYGIGNAASLNGAIHVAATDWKNAPRPLVLTFDLSDEVFREISVPNGMFREGDLVSTSVFQGLLSLLCYATDEDTGEKCCSIWVMKEYGIVESWTKQFTVDLNGEIERVLGVRKNGHILVEAQERISSELSSYDPESQQVQRLGICGFKYFHLDNYMENLVLLDKPTDPLTRRRVSRKRKCR